jgi:tRNA-specific 2-thiouridylase
MGMVSAVSLFSGSLASLVATRLVMAERGVEAVRLLHFRSPFFCDYEKSRDLSEEHLKEADFRSQSIKKDFRIVAQSTADGIYSLPTGCFNCRALMLRKAIRYMRKVGAEFLVTGEIIGERGLEAEDILRLTEEASATGLVLRPLSAKSLPETIAEEEGWVKRSHMKALRSSDKEKLRRLAKEMGICSEGFSASKRCKLTWPHFGERLEDLLKEETLNPNSLELLEFPIYYKHPPDVKIVIARSDEEKRRLQSVFLPEDLRLYMPVAQGSMALVRANWREKTPLEIESTIELAARIAVTHCRQPVTGRVPTHWRFEKGQETNRIHVSPFQSEKEIEKFSLRLVR